MNLCFLEFAANPTQIRTADDLGIDFSLILNFILFNTFSLASSFLI